MNARTLVTVVLVALVGAQLACARPPALLDEACKAIRQAAMGGEGSDVAAEVAFVSQFLPAQHAQVLKSALDACQKGEKEKVGEILKGMPAYPELSVQPLGAAQQVPGSCHLLRTPTLNVLFDCGMDQGRGKLSDEANKARFPFDPKEIDLLVVTHAHIDHTGLIPKLVAAGFTGRIVTTKTTGELLAVLLEDSAKIQLDKAKKKAMREGRNQGGDRARRGGGRDRGPRASLGDLSDQVLYTKEDVAATMKLVTGLDYGCEFGEVPGIRLKMVDAGHLPGSASVEASVKYSKGEYKIVFSGDLGNSPYPLLRDPQPVQGGQTVFIESTYGNRLHGSADLESRYQSFKKKITEAISDGGYTIIPAFAVGRAETLLFWLARMKADGSLKAEIPVVLDSPMAIKTLDIMARHPECMDQKEAEAGHGPNKVFAEFPNRILGLGKDQATGQPETPPPNAIIIASSGMCTGGKVVDYLRRYIGDPKTDVLFSGYQAKNTPGAKLLEGAKTIDLMGGQEDEDNAAAERRVTKGTAVRAKIDKLEDMSGHADQSMLVGWIEKMSQKPSQVVVVHGEPDSGKALCEKITERLHLPNVFPPRGEVIVLGE